MHFALNNHFQVLTGIGKNDLDVVTLREMLALSWREDKRDFQMFAVDLATKHQKLLCSESVAECKETLECIKTLITTKSWWDTVDILAASGSY